MEKSYYGCPVDSTVNFACVTHMSIGSRIPDVVVYNFVVTLQYARSNTRVSTGDEHNQVTQLISQ